MYLQESNRLCSCVPLLGEQAIEDAIHRATMQPHHLAQNPFLDKAEALGDGATAQFVDRTGDHDFLQLVLLDRHAAPWCGMPVEEHQLQKVVISCAIDKLRSRAVAERLGFVQEGVLRQVVRLHGRSVDGVFYGLLAKEWHA